MRSIHRDAQEISTTRSPGPGNLSVSGRTGDVPHYPYQNHNAISNDPLVYLSLVHYGYRMTDKVAFPSIHLRLPFLFFQPRVFLPLPYVSAPAHTFSGNPSVPVLPGNQKFSLL